MHGEVALKNERGDIHFLEPPHSISDQIYERLKQQILYGELEPGERLMQNQVAETLKASRTPVREAFRRLEQDGLVERVPQGGVRVTPMDMGTIKKIFGIRGVLEAYAVELACACITPKEIATLKQLLHQANDILQSADMNGEIKLRNFFELNTQFHDTIYRAAGNSYLTAIINNLRDIVRRMRYLGLSADSTWSQVWDEHAQLIHCLEQRDKEEAIRLTKMHLVNAASYVISALGAESKHSGRPH
jgi:DNA-binding GntR family transcriptional regulator